VNTQVQGYVQAIDGTRTLVRRSVVCAWVCVGVCVGGWVCSMEGIRSNGRRRHRAHGNTEIHAREGNVTGQMARGENEAERGQDASLKIAK
jgi:hypothetical protein